MNDIEEGKVYKEYNNKNNSMIPGDLQRSPDESFFSQNTIVFIDDGFLAKLSKYFAKNSYILLTKQDFYGALLNKEKGGR